MKNINTKICPFIVKIKINIYSTAHIKLYTILCCYDKIT